MVYVAIIKNRLRTIKGMLRHFWPSLLGLFLGIVFLGHQLFVVVMGGGFGNALDSKYVFYVHCACVLLNGYRLLSRNNPVITVNAATLHYLYYTTYFRKILIAEYLWSLFKNMLAAFLVAGLISGFQVDAVFAWNAVLLSGYLYGGILLSWIRYHGKEKLPLTAGICYVLASLGLLISSKVVSLILIGSVTFWGVYYVFCRLHHLNLIKYSRDIAFIDKNISIASQFDMAKMMQVAMEHNANRKRSFLLYHLPLKKNNAVFCKCFIETIRAGNRIWAVILALLVIGILIYRTQIFADIPIVGEPAMTAPISVLFIMSTYINIGEMLNKQLKTLLDKHRRGLFLPITLRQTVLSYVVFGSLIYTLLTVSVGLLMTSKWYLMLLFLGLYIPISILDMVIKVKVEKFGEPVQMVIRIFLIMLGYLFVA